MSSYRLHTKNPIVPRRTEKNCVEECIDGSKYSKNTYIEALTTEMSESPSDYIDVKNQMKKKNKTEKGMVDIFMGVSHCFCFIATIHTC